MSTHRGSHGPGRLGVSDPTSWEADVVLRDGSVCHLRPIRPSDRALIQAFHAKQSPESIYLRFFAPIKEISAKDLTRFTEVDQVDRVALVATVRDDIIGIGRYDVVDPGVAEVAFNISDHYQGKGIGSVLLEHLAAIGQELGIEEFVADVLPQNRKMMKVFTDAGYEVKHHFDDGVIAVSFQIRPTVRSEMVRLSREHRSEAASIKTVLEPDSVVVVGASPRVEALGHLILDNLVRGGFAGRTYAVHPTATEVLGVPCRPTVSAIGEPIDLAVVAVPASEVLGVVDDCAAAGVKSLVVASNGFAESGPEGLRLQQELRARAHANGLRVVGPNTIGVANSTLHLNATVAPRLPHPGRLGLFAQSGALGVAVLATAARRNVGVSVFASAGNRADVSGNDLMQYFIDDPHTEAVGMHLESVGNPRKFSRIARQLAASKPVIVVKSGYSGYSVPPGHTVRPTQVPRAAFDAMMTQAGVMRVENVHQLFDVAALVTSQPLPAGRRVGIVGNAHALGALTADACLDRGLVVTHGPVSLAPEASAQEFAAALHAALDDEQVDAVVTCFIPPLVTADESVVSTVSEVAAQATKPILSTFLGMRGVADPSAGPTLGHGGVPTYPMPEDAVLALDKVSRYAAWRDTDKGERVTYEDIDRHAAFAVIDQVLQDAPAGRALTDDEAGLLLRAYGVPVWPRVRVASADEAVAAAERLGHPVMMKSVSQVLRHSPGLGALRLDLDDAEEVREAFAHLTARFGSLGDPALVVQAMASPGVACVIRSTEDTLFGPVVSFSVAGPPTELLEDVAHRIPPLTDHDVHELVTSVKAFPLLDGHRGAEPVDLPALEEIIGRISVLADDFPEVSALELNPVQASAGGVEVLGAEIAVAKPGLRTDADRRAMTA
ncbi:bifunctional acetate--CoA ligase family protein/GNAT family N-acetyltransferase [Arsenicicoccus sp. oral taxon 190]|uniref:bifunctional acetate--CoA ligase family protein/GNAT family N-acetyltransferase n=1 Tax=Arsenicicoccus sp. oral taxon 190 TaxID=1658671 RepID=UPI00067A3D6D|nr:GNAT family N-acetyltransferase [Arsenicicoccus sp. oral taxon 190]AKT52019.1 multidrug ABC transporter permease [Arsenicicoccus sp. oral taxon 190]